MNQRSSVARSRNISTNTTNLPGYRSYDRQLDSNDCDTIDRTNHSKCPFWVILTGLLQIPQGNFIGLARVLMNISAQEKEEEKYSCRRDLSWRAQNGGQAASWTCTIVKRFQARFRWRLDVISQERVTWKLIISQFRVA